MGIAVNFDIIKQCYKKIRYSFDDQFNNRASKIFNLIKYLFISLFIISWGWNESQYMDEMFLLFRNAHLHPVREALVCFMKVKRYLKTTLRIALVCYEKNFCFLHNFRFYTLKSIQRIWIDLGPFLRFLKRLKKVL